VKSKKQLSNFKYVSSILICNIIFFIFCFKINIWASVYKNNALHIYGGNYVDISSGDYSSIKNQVTIEFWAKGDDVLPDSNSVLEAIDVSENRIIGLHVGYF